MYLRLNLVITTISKLSTLELSKDFSTFLLSKSFINLSFSLKKLPIPKYNSLFPLQISTKFSINFPFLPKFLLNFLFHFNNLFIATKTFFYNFY